MADRGGAARPAQGLRHAPDRRTRWSITDSFFEIGRKFGGSAITGLARLDGWPVAVLASDPYFYGGGWTADAGQKVTRFVDLADTFHLPVVHLVDMPGFVIGVEAEKAGTIRHGARALAAIYQARCRGARSWSARSFGVAGAAHQNHDEAALPLCLAVGRLGLAAGRGRHRGGLSRRAGRQSPDPAALRAEIEERLNRCARRSAPPRRLRVEEIIDPRDTRPLLCEFANLAAKLREAGPVATADAPVKRF